MSEVVNQDEIGTVQTRVVYVKSHGDVLLSSMSVDQILKTIKEQKESIKALTEVEEAANTPVITGRIGKHNDTIKALVEELERRT